MPGTKQHSGGRRNNAGRPPRRFTLEIGRKYTISKFLPDSGKFPMKYGLVMEVQRDELIIEFEDGEQLIIGR